MNFILPHRDNIFEIAVYPQRTDREHCTKDLIKYSADSGSWSNLIPVIFARYAIAILKFDIGQC